MYVYEERVDRIAKSVMTYFTSAQVYWSHRQVVGHVVGRQGVVMITWFCLVWIDFTLIY
jgi:hypothetical protein